ncbi:MAG: MotA/TolQ/ExbB proton channel family protein [Gammaproteobacteria bacterium]|nr:MotA/TolQ/ExbB proton channel family protein [Gammaproteobacteria bacterium]
MKKFLIQAILIAFTFGAGNALAQPKTLDELLLKVKAGAIAESKEYKEREREFRQAVNQQQALLTKAQRERDAEERRSVELEATYNQQEEELAQLTDLLTKRLGSLRELFGVLQQVAGDARGKFETSVVSAQLPGRGVFLADLAKKMGTATELATIEEIERVVYELQREMTEAGKVVRFKAVVNEPDGNKVEKDVIRIGAFNLVADGKYLQYNEENQSVDELLRQPADYLLSTVDDLEDADPDEYVRVGLDPSRGSILSLLVLAPSWYERATQQGGFIGGVIIFGGSLGLLLAIWRWMAVGSIRRKVHAQIASDTPSDNNPLGRVLAVYQKNKSVDTETLELKLGEAILKETPEIVKLISLLKIIAVVAPLMGLLGTVTGMINTFQAITLFGAGDPKLMAGGISQALVTTMLGLWVAIPMTLAHSVVNSRSKSIIHVLEEQSAGIIAAHNERKGG